MNQTDAINRPPSQLNTIDLDLHTYTIRLYFQNRQGPFEVHFDKPSRRFYFSLICLIVMEMKKLGKPGFVYIRKHEKTLKLLDTSLAGAYASKTVKGMWDKIRKAWRHRLPDLETGALFKVLDRNQIAPYEKGGKFRYVCSEFECDTWANLFSYDANNPWRLKFAIDSADVDLKNIYIISKDLRNDLAWQDFISKLKIRPVEAAGQDKVQPQRRKTAAIVFTIVFAVAFLTAVIWYVQTPRIESTAQHRATDKAVIAILPFVNLSNDPQQEYFSDGITDDLITDLSKISGILVISRNSTFTYKGKAVKAQQIGKELGVGYLLEGSVRKVGDKIRINTQLIDATTGHHLWAERYDGNLSDIFGLQDKITQEVVAKLAIKLTADDKSHLSRRETENVAAYEAYLQGLEHQHRDTRENLVKAVSCFKEAIALDPDYSEAHAALSLAYQHIAGRAWDEDLGWKDTRALAQKHLDIAMLDPTPLALRMKSRALLFFEHRHEAAIAQAKQALSLDPNDADSLFYLARALSFSGQHAESIALYEKAMRLNPYYPSWYPQHLGIALYCLERYEDAAKMQESAVRVNPNTSAWWIAATYAQLGQDDKAAQLLTDYIKKRGWHLCYVEATFKFWPFKDLHDLDRFAGGLAKAGLPRPENPAYRRKYSEAIAQAQQAISSNPSDATAYRTMAEALILAGRLSEAMDFVDKAISLEPDNTLHLYTRGLAQFCLGRYEAAAQSLENFSNYHNDHIPGWLLAANFALLDKQEKAQKALTDHLKANRIKYYSVEQVINTYLYGFKDANVLKHFSQGLNKAGLPSEKDI